MSDKDKRQLNQLDAAFYRQLMASLLAKQLFGSEEPVSELLTQIVRFAAITVVTGSRGRQEIIREQLKILHEHLDAETAAVAKDAADCNVFDPTKPFNIPI